MTFKILLPLLIGLFIYFLGKNHARRGRVPSAAGQSTGWMVQVRHSFRLAASLLVGIAVLVVLWVIYDDWRLAHQQVHIRVVNVQTGAFTEYEALRGQVQGRIFYTLDGRQVRLADVERLEMGEK
ncbi:MAG: antitermination protein NusG [Magnetococcales bacterium]|nr:antitermination protein NusG [Magnetococcales bacterium]